MQVYEELVDEMTTTLIARHQQQFGSPCAGSTSDVWSLPSCRESFGCLRASVVLDGDMLAKVSGCDEYAGTLVDFCPLLAFSRFAETRHTGSPRHARRDTPSPPCLA